MKKRKTKASAKITVASLKKDLKELGIKVYRKNGEDQLYIRKSDAEQALANLKPSKKKVQK